MTKHDSMKNILVINAGSSSEKLSFFQMAGNNQNNIASQESPDIVPQQALWQKEIDFPSGDVDSIDWHKLLTEALKPLLEGKVNSASNNQSIHIDLIGHRVVHGGDKYSSAVIIDDEAKKNIEKYIPLAPLHNKVSFKQINTLEKLLPNAKQIAVFDTAFHRTLPDAVSFYPIPYDWHNKYGIRRFGFHGINHQYCSKQAARILERDPSSLSLITCHLGSGCSLAAIENGKSVNTTMGFTPLEGLMMASRSGSIDPSILLYLLKNKYMTVEELEFTLYKNSGLKGISQVGADMKTIIEIMGTNKKEAQFARLAFDMFIARLRANICAMRASLSKLDAIVFTGGIGENSSLVREKACEGLEFLGVELLDENGKLQNSGRQNNYDRKISSPASEAVVLIIKAREDWEIAEQCVKKVEID